MKNLKKFLCMSAIFALSLSYLVGCSSPVEEVQDTPTTQETPSTQSDTTTTEPSLPTVARAGNEVVIPAEINRIISTAPSNTEILVALGLSDKLVAIDSYSGDIAGIPTDVELVNFRNADAEALVTMTPDILIASGHNQVGSEDPYALLKEAGL